MGNSSGKESRSDNGRRLSRHPSHDVDASPAGGAGGPLTPTDRTTRPQSSRVRHGSRGDSTFLGIPIVRDGGDPAVVETRRETRAEREARKLAKERELRAKERERSMKEESVDGGFLVTLGTYTGPEDFSKPTVRQLMIERKIAPFWRGLDDHDPTWVEHQLIAVAHGKPLPPADQKPEAPEASPAASNINLNNLTVPINARSPSTQSEQSMTLSASHPAFSNQTPAPQQSSSTTFFRNRSKTLSAFSSSSKPNASQTELAPQECQLPRDPYHNGVRIEAILYRDVMECPICVLEYPPYLNKTRCCDQPICSECFVQIKRPDPHVPEHHGDSTNANPTPESSDGVNLVSEPAACPYCAQPELGVTYEPPPFRRGLAYAGSNGHYLSSAMSSTTSLQSGLASPNGTRRRATSLSATAPGVITTDRVRPDWAKKLSDARAHALRRSAAATALHNAAYVLNQQGESSRFGRRRRTMFGDSPSSSGRGTPRGGEGSGPPLGSFLIPIDRNRDLERLTRERAGSEGRAHGDMIPDRRSSANRRIEDIEELMMMEAIRLSLAAEDDRTRKEEKEAAKQAKKEEKQKAKEAKKAAKESRKSSLFGSSSAMASRNSLGNAMTNKGKEIDRTGDQTAPPLPTSSSSKFGPQQHLEESRARLEGQVPDSPFSQSVFSALGETSHRQLLRERSNNSSDASSIEDNTFMDGPPLRNGQREEAGLTVPAQDDSDSSAQPTPNAVSPMEPMVNFSRLTAEFMDNKDNEASASSATHIERIAEDPEKSYQTPPAQHPAVGTSVEPALSEAPLGAIDGLSAQHASDGVAPVRPSSVAGSEKSMDHKMIGDVGFANTKPHQIS